MYTFECISNFSHLQPLNMLLARISPISPQNVNVFPLNYFLYYTIRTNTEYVTWKQAFMESEAFLSIKSMWLKNWPSFSFNTLRITDRIIVLSNLYEKTSSLSMCSNRHLRSMADPIIQYSDHINPRTETSATNNRY